MTRLAMRTFGYTFSVHKEGEDPENGFGFHDESAAPLCTAIGARGALSIVNEWNSYTAETCPHKAILRGPCGLCGNKYVLTRLLEDGTNERVTLENLDAEEKSAEKSASGFSEYAAKVVETFSWSHARLRGVVLEHNGHRLLGMLNIDLDDLDRSLQKELIEYQSGYMWAVKGESGTEVLSGPWAEIDVEQVSAAVRAVLAES